MWETIKSPFLWLQNKWLKFEQWVASWAPGAKTQLVTALGVVGEGAALGQEYITGIPLDKFISGTTVTLISVGLFTLAFWFRRLTKVQA